MYFHFGRGKNLEFYFSFLTIFQGFLTSSGFKTSTSDQDCKWPFLKTAVTDYQAQLELSAVLQLNFLLIGLNVTQFIRPQYAPLAIRLTVGILKHPLMEALINLNLKSFKGFGIRHNASFNDIREHGWIVQNTSSSLLLCLSSVSAGFQEQVQINRGFRLLLGGSLTAL